MHLVTSATYVYVVTSASYMHLRQMIHVFYMYLIVTAGSGKGRLEMLDSDWLKILAAFGAFS